MKFNSYGDEFLGKLVPFDFGTLEFFPVRSFIVFDSKKGVVRGNHAHLKCRQLLVCVKGEILLDFINSEGEFQKTLKEGDFFLLENMVWCSQQFLTGNDILKVFCDLPYTREDYIENKDQFIKMIRNENN